MKKTDQDRPTRFRFVTSMALLSLALATGCSQQRGPDYMRPNARYGPSPAAQQESQRLWQEGRKFDEQLDATKAWINGGCRGLPPRIME